MNDLVLNMVASQLGIPPQVLKQMKAARPDIVSADFHGDLVTISLVVVEPANTFNVTITLPSAQLKRFPTLFAKVAKVGRG